MSNTSRWASMILLCVVLIPGEAQAAECGCDDIDDINASILSVSRTRTGWYSVLADMSGRGAGAPKTDAEAIARFEKHMGWTSTRKVGGLSPTGEIIIDPKYAAEHCTGVVDGVREHESAHFWYIFWRIVPGLMSSERNLALMLVKSEIDARDVQMKHLKRLRAKLMKKCGREYTPDPEPQRIQG